MLHLRNIRRIISATSWAARAHNYRAVGRLLILSAFGPVETRITADLAARRNAIVCALATETLILYATPGGRLENSLNQKPLPLATQ